MPLQIRRGTEGQRPSITPLNGEPVYSSDTKKLFIGDGSTPGGVTLGYYGRVEVSGQDTLSATGNRDVLTVVAGSNIAVTTNSTTNSITISAATTFSELQNESIRIYQNNIIGLNSNENINVDPAGTGKLIVTGSTDIVGNLVVSGTVDGTFIGDVTGSVFADNSTLLVDAVSGVLRGPLIGNVTGNVTGDIIGNVTGNVFTSLIDSADSSAITVTPKMIFSSDVEIQNAVVVNNGSTFNGRTTFNQGPLVSEITDNPQAFEFRRARGTPASPQPVQDTSTLGIYSFSGYNGTEFLTGALINATVDGVSAVTANGIQTNLSFSVSNSAGEFYTPLRITGDGGYVIVPGLLRCVSETGGGQSVVNIEEFHEERDSNGFGFERGRGTRNAPLSVQTNDDIIDLSFKAYDGTSVRNVASISVIVDGAVSTNNIAGKIVFRLSEGPNPVERFTIESNGDIVSTAAFLTSGTGGIGYITGAGGSATQTTDKSTGVTLNKITGEITMDSASLNGDTSVSFTLTNSTIEANDHIIVTHVSGGTLGAYNSVAVASSGAASITVRNLTSGSLSEAIVLKFTVIKSAIT